MLWLIALAIFIVICLCLFSYSLGWQRGFQNNPYPITISGAEEAPEPEVMVPSIEMVDVLPPTTGPLDILVPRMLVWDNIPEMKQRIAHLEEELDKATRAKTRHWATVQRLKRTAA